MVALLGHGVARRGREDAVRLGGGAQPPSTVALWGRGAARRGRREDAVLLGADGEEERGVEERGKGQGQIGHFTVLLSPQQLEINILLDGVSTSKFVRNQSVH